MTPAHSEWIRGLIREPYFDLTVGHMVAIVVIGAVLSAMFTVKLIDWSEKFERKR